MSEPVIARELLPRLKSIAHARGLVIVRRVELIVGVLHQASADELAAAFEKTFHGTSFDGATVDIIISKPGQEIIPPNSSEPTVANGWEVLVSSLEGDE